MGKGALIKGIRIKRGNYLKDIETLLMHLVTTHTGATRSIAASAIHE